MRHHNQISNILDAEGNGDNFAAGEIQHFFSKDAWHRSEIISLLITKVVEKTTLVPVQNTDLEDHKAEEVDVGEPLQLLEEVEREEGDDVVLGRLDGIVLRQKETTNEDF